MLYKLPISDGQMGRGVGEGCQGVGSVRPVAYLFSMFGECVNDDAFHNVRSGGGEFF